MFHKVITYRFFKVLENIDKGSIQITTPDGRHFDFVGPNDGQDVVLEINDWRAVTAFATKADIGLAESYRDGWWETNDLEGLLLFGMENQNALNSYINGNALSHLVSQFMYLFTRNTVRGSSKNIHAHYDLGNEFYKLWLDPTMSYSAALDVRDDEALAVAQNRKYDRILSCLDDPKGPLLEVGCGWGGFAERAVTTTDADVKAITISQAQHSFAKDRLSGAANIALEDYRHQDGKYDHIVSIEMFEAVGEAFWQTYFKKLKSLLSSKGKAVIQTITVDDQLFDLYRRSGDMIRTFIFPGGMLPSPSRFDYEAKRAGLKTGGHFEFGQDYAFTMEVWLKNFEENLTAIRGLGFDEAFIRLWRFYLSCCIALFKSKRTNVMHVELAHA